MTRLWLMALTVLVSAGCGGKDLYQVRGKVVFPDGAPLAGGWVVFEKTEDGATHTSDSPVQEDGAFELRTFEPGDGARPGKYRVLVKPRERILEEQLAQPPLLHRKFTRFDTSGIELVVEAKPNVFQIEVTK